MDVSELQAAFESGAPPPRARDLGRAVLATQLTSRSDTRDAAMASFLCSGAASVRKHSQLVGFVSALFALRAVGHHAAVRIGCV